jgi:hypothetical protein
MLSTLLENYLLRLGPWRALAAIFALGLALVIAIVLGQPVTGVAPPSEVPLVPPRLPMTARSAAVQPPSEPTAAPAASEAAPATAPTAAPEAAATPAGQAAAPAPIKTPDDPRPSSKEVQRQALEGRLGDTRQNIEAFLGPPAAHLSGQEFLYRAPTRFTITYSHSGRAMLFTIWSPRDPKLHPLAHDPKDWPISQAREIASLFLPLDAQHLHTRKGFLGQPEDLYYSEALARAIGRADYVLAGAKGPPGTLGVMFTLTESGFVSMFTIGIR